MPLTLLLRKQSGTGCIQQQLNQIQYDLKTAQQAAYQRQPEAAVATAELQPAGRTGRTRVSSLLSSLAGCRRKSRLHLCSDLYQLSSRDTWLNQPSSVIAPASLTAQAAAVHATPSTFSLCEQSLCKPAPQTPHISFQSFMMQAAWPSEHAPTAAASGR